ncbi:MAG: DsrE family protein [Lewinellaceae bacterium]|nr:DsrE family protein [Lewinellaceae bacterium]
MRTLLFFLLFIGAMGAGTTTLKAQAEAPVVVTQKKLKMVIQLATDDTLVHKAIFRQFQNFLNAAPNAKIEVVCHNNGLSFLKKNSPYATKVQEYAGKGIDFVACENTMRQRKVTKQDLIPECRTVPAGLVEIVMKQQKKYAYIKAGF